MPEEEEENNEEIEVTKKERSESPLLEAEPVDTSKEKHEIEQIVVIKHTFWDKLAWMKLSVEEKAIIVEGILEEIQNKPLYWVQLIISVVIVTFGLLQSSAAVIIGGMLIAPILKPIKGLAFGMTTGQPSYFWKSAWLQFLSIVIAVFSAYVFSLIIPLKIETPEIISRTSPNILDLLIAIASGIIAMLSLYFKKLSETIAGVAMAAALVPPLAVVGIELALGNNSAAAGSAFLFVTNLFAILAVGVIIFLFYGFSPHRKDTKNIGLRVISMIFVLLIYISFPLFASLMTISDRNELQSEAAIILESFLEENLPESRFRSLNIIEFDEESVQFSGTILVEEGVSFLVEDQNKVHEQLSEGLGREVSLELEVVPIIFIQNVADQV